MTPVAVVRVPGGTIDVGRQGGSVALRIRTNEGEGGLTLCPTPDQARQIAMALMRMSTVAAIYADRPTPMSLVGHEPA